MEYDAVVSERISNPLERLLSRVACCMLREPKYYSTSDNMVTLLLSDLEEVGRIDPEFISQAAYYTRQVLNVRSTSNFLLAYAFKHSEAKKYVSKYFNHATNLPTDVLEVVDIYQALVSDGMQVEGKIKVTKRMQECIKEKFAGFNTYQLGKYCSEGRRKRALIKIKQQKKKLQEYEQAQETAQKVYEDAVAAGVVQVRPVRNKKMTKPKVTEKNKGLSFKQLVRLCHIAKPASAVMAVLGKRYPATLEEFEKSQLEGEFDESKARKRMKIETPETWETMLSARGNSATTWEYLIRSKKLPFMAMLRNLRNLLITGVDSQTHDAVLQRLQDPEVISKSRIFPFGFLSAFDSIEINLEELRLLKEDPNYEPPKPTGKRGLKTPAKVKKIIPNELPTEDLIHRYKEALENSIKIATTLNVKPLRGRAAVFCDCSGSMGQPISQGKSGMGSMRTCMDAGMMLGLMISYVCETADFKVFAAPKAPGEKSWRTVEIESDKILANVALAKEKASELCGSAEYFPYDFLEENMIAGGPKLDMMFVFTDVMVHPGQEEYKDGTDRWTITKILKEYREKINPNLLFITCNLSSYARTLMSAEMEDDYRNIAINGYSDSILRLVSELQKSQVQAVKDSCRDIIIT